MNRTITTLAVALCLCVSACGASTQRDAINDARVGIEATDIAWEATDAAVADVYGSKPTEDTESYCHNKIASMALAQVDLSMDLAEDAVHAWEVSLDIYEAKKAAGTVGDVDWSKVLSSEADWLRVAVVVSAGMGAIRSMLDLWGVDLPSVVDNVWSFVAGLGGREVTEYEFDWSDLQGSVCADYIGGE